MYALFSIFCFHRADCHSSAIPTEVFRVFSSAVRQMPVYNSQRRGTARTLPKFVLFYVLFVLCCSMYCLRVNVHCTTATVSTQLQLTNISYHTISYHIISYIISYHITSYHSYHIMSYHIISYHISYHTTSHHITSHHIMSYHIISYHIIPHHITSYHIISNHIIYHIGSQFQLLSICMPKGCVANELYGTEYCFNIPFNFVYYFTLFIFAACDEDRTTGNILLNCYNNNNDNNSNNNKFNCKWAVVRCQWLLCTYINMK